MARTSLGASWASNYHRRLELTNFNTDIVYRSESGRATRFTKSGSVWLPVDTDDPIRLVPNGTSTFVVTDETGRVETFRQGGLRFLLSIQERNGFRRELIEAMAAKDVVKLREMYVGSYTHTHGSGKVDGKDARLVALLAGDPVIENAPVEDFSIRTFNSDTAVVTGKSPILNKAENRMYDFRWLAVYVKAHGKWHVAASQATPPAAAAVRADADRRQRFNLAPHPEEAAPERSAGAAASKGGDRSAVGKPSSEASRLSPPFETLASLAPLGEERR